MALSRVLSARRGSGNARGRQNKIRGEEGKLMLANVATEHEELGGKAREARPEEDQQQQQRQRRPRPRRRLTSTTSSSGSESVRLQVLLMVPTSAQRGGGVASVLAPYEVFSRRCDVRTVTLGTDKEQATELRFGVMADLTAAEAPTSGVDVVVVPAGVPMARVSRWLRRFKGEDVPMLVRTRGNSVRVYRPGQKKKRAESLAAQPSRGRLHADVALDVLDLLYQHKEDEEEAAAAKAAENGENSDNSSSDDSTSSSITFPGDLVAEEIRFYRNRESTDLARYTAKVHPLKRIRVSFASLFRETLVAVALYDGVDELSVAALTDTWRGVSGVTVVPLVFGGRELPSGNWVVRGASGAQLFGRAASDFAKYPASISSLRVMLLGPGVAPNAKRRAALRQQVVAFAANGADCVVQDHSDAAPSNIYGDSLKFIETRYSLPVAQVACGRMLGRKEQRTRGRRPSRSSSSSSSEGDGSRLDM